ncbi:unnamed protein product [marine sediment metagenome]|uniref:Uncharacterized protein n=1 Tax=marine sediment metagenome TaxID=412755 RepID=X0XY15_9ZZZZ
MPRRFAPRNDRKAFVLKAFRPSSGISQKRTESAFKRTQKFKKSGN